MSETPIYIYLATLSFIVGCSGAAMIFNKRFAYIWVRWQFIFGRFGESEENLVRATQRVFGPLYMIVGFGAAIGCIVIATD